MSRHLALYRNPFHKLRDDQHNPERAAEKPPPQIPGRHRDNTSPFHKPAYPFNQERAS